MKYENIKKMSLGVLMSVLFLGILNGCGLASFGKNIGKLVLKTSSEDYSKKENSKGDYWDKLMDQFVVALDKHDKKGIMNCFSDYVNKHDQNLDKEIEELFQAYTGKTDSWKWSLDSTQDYSDAPEENREYITRTAVLNSNGKNYYLYVEITTVDLSRKGRFGLCCVDFTTPEVQAALRSHRLDLIDYESKSSWEQEDHYKIHVTTKHKGDYETRRICNYEEIFNPSEVKYSAHEYVSFVKTNHSIKDFQIKYGMENAGDEDCLYYQVNDGDNLYVMLFKGGKEGQDITQIDLVNEDNYVKTLYVEPE